MIKPLTSLRFLFALMVFTHHISEKIINVAPGWVYDLFLEGYIGVSFFFILSGFILSYTYQEKIQDGTIPKSGFWIARLARIYPLHLVTMALAIPFLIGYPTTLPKWVDFLFHVSLTQSFIPITTTFYGFNSVAWSISNEAFFYFLFPFFITACSKKNYFFFLFVITAMLVPFLSSFVSEPTEWIFKINPVFRFIDFGIGILIFQLYKHTKKTVTEQKGTLLEMYSVLMLLCFIGFRNYIPVVFRHSSYYWLPMALVIFAFSFQKGILSKLLSFKVLIVLGEVSFAFYMVHQLVLKYMSAVIKRLLPALNNHIILLVMLMVAISLVASFMLHFYIEKPSNKFVKQLFGQRRLITHKSPTLEPASLKEI